MDRWLARASLMLSVTKSIADAVEFAPLKGACEAVVTLLDSIQAVKSNEYAWSELLRTVQEHTTTFRRQLAQLGINDILEEYEDSIKGPISDYFDILKELIASICIDSGLEESEFDKGLTFKRLAQQIATTKLEAGVIAGYEKRLKDAESRIMGSLIVYVTISVNASADADVLSQLKCKEYTRPRECQVGTRTEILEQCTSWVCSPNAPNILWIKAAPGAGKSAIASSLVRLLGIHKQRLGSSFFFRRQESTVTTTRALWRNVAHDLARHPTIRKHLAAKIKKGHIDLTTPNIGEFFHQLIEEPLLRVGSISSDQSPVIVVDALDECGGLEGANSEERRDLIETLALWSQLSHCKLIVTSREEDDIARNFALNPPYTIDLLVGDETAIQSTRDIQAYLSEELGKIAGRYSTPSAEWPGEATIRTLAIKANGLFIWASTVVEYIRRGNPKKLLEEIVRGEGTAGMKALYTTVLHAAFPDARSDLLREVRTILAAIIVSYEPFHLPMLAELLGMDEWTVEHVCNALRPVLEIEGTLRFRHQSFVDHLLDPDTTYLAPCLTTSNCHQILADRSLCIMKEKLQFNICGIPSSHILNEDVLESTIDACIPSHLVYASSYWVDHLEHTPASEETLSLVRYILKVQFLAWLEVASLCHFVYDVPPLIFVLNIWLKANNGDDLIPLATDMQQFVAHFLDIIAESASHIYISALPLSPPSSAVRRLYESQYPKTLLVTAGGYQRWSPLRNTVSGHNSGVSTVAFSPDGHYVVSGSHDGTVRRWDVKTGIQIETPLEGHTSFVSSVAFSPGGDRVVSGSDDKTIRVWDMKMGTQIGIPFEGHADRVKSVAFSPDGRQIISGSGDRTIRLWDADTGGQIGLPLQGHTDAVNSVAFFPDGHRIISGSNDKTLRIWNVETGMQIGEPIVGHTDYVHSVAISPDGRRIASGSDDKTIQIWDANTGMQIGIPLEGYAGAVLSVGFSPDGHRIVSGSFSQMVQVWDVETGRQIGQPLEGHSGCITSVAFSPDGRQIVSGSDDATLKLWSVETDIQIGGPLEGHTSGVSSIAILPNHCQIVSGSDDKTVRIWDMNTGMQIGIPFHGHTGGVNSVACSPDGYLIASGSDDCTVRIWSVDTGRGIGTPLEGHTDPVTAVAFSPDGHRIVSGSDDQTVRIWDVKMGTQIGVAIEGHIERVTSVVFSPDGCRIVSGSQDKTVRFWDAETGTQIGVPLEGHTKRVKSVAFSPDGHRIVSCSDDKTLRFWDVNGGIQIGTPLEGHAFGVTSVAFSPDGRRIVSGSEDDTIRLWDVETGLQIGMPLQGHNASVCSVTFSPDGHQIISGSSDQTVRLWNVTDEHLTDVVPSCYCGIDEDGWLFGSEGEILFWVPPHCRSGLERPGVRIIGPCHRMTVDTSAFVHGAYWTRVREGGMIKNNL